MPSNFAASSRPCPAITLPFSSTKIGLVKPNARMLSAICRICRLLWVRGLRASGWRANIA